MDRLGDTLQVTSIPSFLDLLKTQSVPITVPIEPLGLVGRGTSENMQLLTFGLGTWRAALGTRGFGITET